MSTRLVKEIRNRTGLSQQAFAKMYDIPVSTLRKWEQGEASPAPYVVRLLDLAVPGSGVFEERIEGKDGDPYYFDRSKGCVRDAAGDAVFIRDDLEGVSRHNLRIYLQDLFKDLQELKERFERDCHYDRKDKIEWS